MDRITDVIGVEDADNDKANIASQFNTHTTTSLLLILGVCIQ